MNPKIFPDMENKITAVVAKEFAINSTKEEMAQKFMEIIRSDATNFEKINDISFICRVAIGEE